MNLGRTRGVVQIMDVGDFDKTVAMPSEAVEVVAEAPVTVEARETVTA